MPTFTLDAMAAFETGTDFTLDAIVKARISSSFALDAYAMQPGATVRNGYFFLGAEVVNPTLATLPLLRSPFTRNRHDRFGLHFGMGLATDIELSSPVGTVSTTVEAALRYLWERLVDAESFLLSSFTLDAYTDEDLYWRDTFARVVADGLGRSTGISRFGLFDWQTKLIESGQVWVGAPSYSGVDASAVFNAQDSQFVGYPTITEGELYFEIFVPFQRSPLEFSIQPWRDDIADVRCYFHVSHVGSTWFFEAGFETVDGDTLLSDSAVADVEEWYAARFVLPGLGGDMQVKVWRRDVDTEPDYDASFPLPNSATGHRWLAMGGAGKSSYSEDALTWSTSGITGLGSDNYQDVCWGDAFGVPTWMTVGSPLGILWARDAQTWTHVTAARSPAGLMPNFWSCATDNHGTWLAINIFETTPWRAIGDPATSFWDRQTTSLVHGFVHLRYGDIFVAVNSFAEIAVSSDGQTWTAFTDVDLGLDEDFDWFEDSAFGGGLWVVVGGGGGDFSQTRTVTSTDSGTTWTTHALLAVFGSDYFAEAIAYGNGLFVIVGYAWSDSSAMIATSPDGVTWTLNNPGVASELRAVSYVDGVWVAVGDDGTLLEATDPTGTWTAQTSGFGSTGIAAVIGRHATNSREAPVLEMAQPSWLEPPELDNIKVLKTDSDPVRRYGVFTLDAEVPEPAFTGTGSATLNAIVKATRSSSFTLNAIVKQTGSGSFTLDAYVGTAGSFTLNALVKATRSASFTLDARVVTETGLLLDHTLGTHELGGG